MNDKELVEKCLLYGVTQQEVPSLLEMYARYIKEQPVTQEQLQRAMLIVPMIDWGYTLKLLAIKLDINYSYLSDTNGRIIARFINK